MAWWEVTVAGARGGWPHCIYGHEGGRHRCWSRLFSPFIQCKVPAHGMLLPTFRVGFPCFTPPQTHLEVGKRVSHHLGTYFEYHFTCGFKLTGKISNILSMKRSTLPQSMGFFISFLSLGNQRCYCSTYACHFSSCKDTVQWCEVHPFSTIPTTIHLQDPSAWSTTLYSGSVNSTSPFLSPLSSLNSHYSIDSGCTKCLM